MTVRTVQRGDEVGYCFAPHPHEGMFSPDARQPGVISKVANHRSGLQIPVDGGEFDQQGLHLRLGIQRR
jgi:hypothetical protein